MRILCFFFLISSFFFQSQAELIKLVLVRNGESTWSQMNLFVGWTDVRLSEKGKNDAKNAGKLLKEGGYIFDICYTSFLKRAIQTAIHLLDEIDQLHIPIVKHYSLNGKHYGALQGLNKKDTLDKYGTDKVKAWRKSYDFPPPSLEETDERNPANQDKYKNYPKENLPLHESLKDTINRVIPYYEEVILPEIKSGKKVLITAHSNSLKALIKHLDDLPEQQILDLKIRNGVPIIYELDINLKPIKRYYLDNQSEQIDIFSQIQDISLKIISVEKLTEEQEQLVYQICVKADTDFVPPLSARTDTIQKFKDIPNVPNSNGPKVFFEEIKKEQFIFIINEGKIEGFMSFIKDYELHLDDEIIICDYITTIIIDSKNRNKGYTKKMYDVILNERKGRNIGTRTWSTNHSHLHILDKLGFKLVRTDKDDRGINIDSVYYLKKS
jgi:2,3-bisphosphoglycerate-dependent phosphoglycerate mutase